MKQLIYYLIIISGFVQNSTKVKEKDLFGPWENTSLTVEMPTHNNSDSTAYLKAEEGEWEKVLKIKPIKTLFKENGTFTSTYFDLENQPLGSETGTWFLRNDSLVMVSNNYGSAYQVILSNDRARFIAYLDWDQDGQKDDLYDGWQKRVK